MPLNCLILVKRTSEAFSLVMTTHNCLRHTYVSSPRIDMHAFQSRVQRASPLLSMRIKYYTPTIPYSSPLNAWKVTVVWTDATMLPFNVISTLWSTPEIILSSKRIYKKAKMKRGLHWIGNELTRFLMVTIFLVYLCLANQRCSRNAPGIRTCRRCMDIHVQSL